MKRILLVGFSAINILLRYNPLTLKILQFIMVPLYTNAVAANNPTTSSPFTPTPDQSRGDSLGRFLENKYYSFQELGERKVWYSKSAKAYNDCRPKYPDEIVDEALKLVTGNRILEIGSGPGTATISLARRGYELLCLEPNPDFCALARENVSTQTQQQQHNQFVVHIENVAFEEASTEGLEFDAIVAATCMHWIPSDVGFPKAAKSLKRGGSLVLLWNMMLTPSSDADFELIKQAHSPDFQALLAWSDEDTQKEVATSVGDIMMESGLFENMRSNEIRRHVIYTAAEYLGLLSTYSFYMRLLPEERSKLFDRIRNVINDELGGSVELSYLSLYHAATKKDS